jgi:hypothetical protein
MRKLTKKERRAVELALKSEGLALETTRMIVDYKQKDDFYMLYITALDGKKSHLIGIPLKSEPSVSAVIEQLKSITKTVTEAL